MQDILQTNAISMSSFPTPDSFPVGLYASPFDTNADDSHQFSKKWKLEE
jgi:hypothetical protein